MTENVWRSIRFTTGLKTKRQTRLNFYLKTNDPKQDKGRTGPLTACQGHTNIHLALLNSSIEAGILLCGNGRAMMIARSRALHAKDKQWLQPDGLRVKELSKRGQKTAK
jgi:hypothetical protein